jgi:putative transposase
MLTWLELLRRHRNWVLGNRYDWLRRTRCQIDRCSLISEAIGDIPELKPSYYNESEQLKQTKKLFPEYKNIYHEVQQQNLMRLDDSWWKWLIPDSSGKRAGRPKFKKKDELRSFTFPRVNKPKAGVHIDNGIIKLSKIGSMPIIMHRPIPDGFEIKTATVVLKADGWYVSLSLCDDSVPSPMPMDAVKTVVGVDVGLKEFLTTSDGQTVPVQQAYRKAQANLARLQRCLARKIQGSNRAKKQQMKVRQIHQRIARQRQDFHYRIAHWLVKNYDLIAVEDLNVKGLARNSKLAKSIYDVAWSAFINILEAVAVKCGVWVVKVNPYSTSQDCSSCGTKVPKTLSMRAHECPKCGLILDRDVNAAVNILERALSAVGLMVPARRGLEVAHPKKRETSWTTLTGIQLWLF